MCTNRKFSAAWRNWTNRPLHYATHSGDKYCIWFLILFKDFTPIFAKSFFHLCPCYRGSLQIPFLLRQLASNKRWRVQDVTPRNRSLEKLTTSSHLRISSRLILVSTSHRPQRLQTSLRPGVHIFSKNLEASSKTLRVTVKEHLVTAATLSPVAYRGGFWGGSTPPPEIPKLWQVEPDCKLSGKCLMFLFQHPK